MEIITGTDFSYERLYCPSTGEVIMGPVLDEITFESKAVVAQWDYEFIGEPTIYDHALEKAWNSFLLKWVPSEITSEMVVKFLSEYENPEWKVFECYFEEMAVGRFSFTLIYVVKADTIVEVHPEFEDEDFGLQKEELDEKHVDRQANIIEITDEELIENINKEIL